MWAHIGLMVSLRVPRVGEPTRSFRPGRLRRGCSAPIVNHAELVVNATKWWGSGSSHPLVGCHPVIGNEPCCQPVVCGDPALALGAPAIGSASHDVASGWNPYHVAEVE